MTITFTPEIEAALTEQAHRIGKTPEGLVLEAVQEKLAAPQKQMTNQEWIALLRSVATPAGVSLSDEAVSRDSLYEDHL